MNTVRQQHNLIQGSPEWAAFRFEHDGASECAAMLGLSKQVSRTELLTAKKTGLPKEFSEFVQTRILDNGHRVEALARPIVEGIIGDDLSPVTYSFGRMSASCDGINFEGSVAFEHKQLNAALVDQVKRGIVPDTHMPQCQQIMLVTGAEKVIFTVSDGTEENLVYTEVLPDQAWFDRIIAGWAQFHKDLADYVPAEEVIKPVAEPMIGLPALSIQSAGSITIKSNLDVFGEQLSEFVGKLNLKPETDQDFANAEAAVKVLQEAQDALEAAEANALAQASDVDAMRRAVAAYAKTARDTRLMLEKVIKAEKENRKLAIVGAAREAWDQHVSDLEAEIKPIRLHLAVPDFGTAIKGLKTMSSIQDKVDGALANGKISADAMAKDIRDKLAWCKTNAEGYGFLFNDLQQIIQKPADDFQLLVNSRIAEHKQAEATRLEQERERIQAEEEAKAKAKVEAEAKAAADAEDNLIASIFANARRIEFDSVQYIEKAIISFEAVAKDWANDPRPRVASAVAEARIEMKSRLDSAKAKAQQNAQGEDAPHKLDTGDGGAAPLNPAATVRPAIVKKTAQRPSDDEIIDVLTLHYRVHESKVLEWLLDMDMVAAGKRMAA